MANGVFNVALGRVNELHDRVAGNDPANSALVVVLLQTVESDSTIKDYASLGALLAEAGNEEADFTNYARKTLTDAEISPSTVDNVNNRREADIPDLVWSAAGGASNNNLVKLLICYDADTTTGDDDDVIPLTFQDFVAVTDGNDLLAQISADGYFRAS